VSTMPNPQRLETGEKTFVIAFLVAFVVEVALATSAALAGAWVGVLLSSFGACFVLYLANRLYGGDAKARQLAIGWVGFSLLVGAVGLYLALANRGSAHAGYHLGVVAPWAGALKVVAYLVLGATLAAGRSSRYFVAVRSGATVAEAEREVEEFGPTGVALKLTPQQAAPLTAASGSLKAASIALVLLGLLFAANAVKDALDGRAALDWMPLLGQGVLVLALGGLLPGPASAVADVTEQGGDTGYILTAFNRLKTLFLGHLAVTALLFVLAALQVLRWMNAI
jgi:hypothetical protein